MVGEIHEYDAMIKFFEPSAFLIEEREETKTCGSSLQDRLDAKRLLAIDANKRSTRPPVRRGDRGFAPDDPRVESTVRIRSLVMITSGTTGFPKGCVIDHETYALRSLNNAISQGSTIVNADF